MTTNELQTALRQLLKATEAPQLLDGETVCQRLSISKGYLSRLVRERRMPHVKVGHLVRFKEEDIAEWLARNERGIHS